MLKNILFTTIFLCMQTNAQSMDDLDLLDSADAQVLIEEKEKPNQLNISELEEIDDLESLKQDVGEMIFDDEAEKKRRDELKELSNLKLDKTKKDKAPKDKITNDKSKNREPVIIKKDNGEEIFDIGPEEKELLGLSKFIESKIPDKQFLQEHK